MDTESFTQKPDGTASVDVPSLLTASDGPLSLLSAVAMASQCSNANLTNTREEAKSLRNSFGKKKGCTSTVIICNKTATLLKFDKASNRRGKVYGPETKNRHVRNYPVEVFPGSNVHFLHVNPSTSQMGQPTYDGTAGALSFRIAVYDVEKESWVDSLQAVAFSWATASGAPNGKVPRIANRAKHENATNNTERFIRRSGSVYDGTKICCDFKIEGADSIHPVYTFTFTQEQRGQTIEYPKDDNVVPFGWRVRQWFGGRPDQDIQSAEEKIFDEKTFDGVQGMTM